MFDRLTAYLDSIRARDPAPRSRAEILLYPGVWALGFHRLAHWLFEGELYFLARLVNHLSRWLTLGGTNPTNGIGGKRHPTLRDNVIIGSGAQIIGPITVGERARVGANAVVTEDVPEGATMIGLKARSTLVPAETWLREFIPYGTPCEEECAQTNGSGERVDALERELASLRDEVAALKAERTPTRKSGTQA